eukprot:TRINITY_DN80723_c0_g1_i1.p1 TRINITY_DN80723_c0_g1~~TRINITY_DN80723_c0_g1_i1.p1  ORF type:complete len:694 (+),score=146.44 TRINITY_DN80723_c0_g1_i1:108-2084(+)
MDYIIGRKVEMMNFVNLEKIIECADKTEWGLNGLGGLWAFEDDLGGPQEEPLPVEVPKNLPALPALKSQELLEKFAPKEDSKLSAPDVIAIPLGCTGLTKASLLSLGLATADLPFDWLQISDAGLLHFLRKGFDAPIRDGLGAGIQRPKEKRGFFDFSTRKKVPDSNLMMCRSHLHSFWHDDVGDPDVRDKFDQQMDHFNSLGLGGETLLFVRTVATETELSRVDELLAALQKKFGQNVALLMICDFQSNTVGAHFAEGNEDVMVYYLEGSAHDEPIPYQKPIKCALDWLEGNEMEAACTPSLAGLQGLAEPTSWGLVGLKNMNAFERLKRDLEEVDREPSQEEVWLLNARYEAAKDALAIVSLGYHEYLGKAIEADGMNAKESPFDGTFVRMEGVLHFIQNDFEDFFDTTAEEKVEIAESGSRYTVRRSCYHSFWDLDRTTSANTSTSEAALVQASQQRFENRIRMWRQLALSDRPKLFVRAAATAEDIALIGEVYTELKKRFKGNVMLLVLVSGQAQSRTFSVAEYYWVLVQFMAHDANVEFAGSVHGFVPSIKTSLDWAVEKDTKAAVVPDFKTLQSLATSPSISLVGPAKVPLFEDLASTTGESTLGAASTDSTDASSTNGVSPVGGGYAASKPPVAPAAAETSEDKDTEAKAD